MNIFMLDDAPTSIHQPRSDVFVVHGALRLTCNHQMYQSLWGEQLQSTWREARGTAAWPVLGPEADRWHVRAAIDAVVADAYGLDRDQYAHILSKFSHASYPAAPAVCLARFDELCALGLEEFARKHDPYRDIPLNDNLPRPVIDIPMPQAEAVGEQGELYETGAGGHAARVRRRRGGSRHG
jgi:hypothetical protein